MPMHKIAKMVNDTFMDSVLHFNYQDNYQSEISTSACFKTLCTDNNGRKKRNNNNKHTGIPVSLQK